VNRTVVIGVGNEFRGDDAAGRVAARRLRDLAPDEVVVHESSGEALSLMERWAGAGRVILIDASSTGIPPGTVQRFDASRAPLPSLYFHTSTHAFSVAEAIEMARSLASLPDTVIVFGIEGGSFEHGTGLTPAAEKGISEVLQLILNEIS
jgi:hydrogenase maturation protease